MGCSFQYLYHFVCKHHENVLKKTNESTFQIWILYYLECPYHTASLRPSSVDVFNWTSTYRRDSDIVAPYEHWVYYDPLIIEKDLDRNFAANKTKKVSKKLYVIKYLVCTYSLIDIFCCK